MHERLVDVLGEEVAGFVMEHLPPVGWADVATKRDIDQLAVVTKREIDQLAVSTKRELEQSTSLLRAEMATGNATLAAELRGEMVRQTRAMIVTLVITMIGSLSTIAAIAH